MHKRIIMLAKIALIIAAAQLHITAANFISNPANIPSNATYAMSNEEEPTIFEDFKKAIENTVQPQTNTYLSVDDKHNIEQTIQNFIKDDEKIALALYIANQWDIIKELGWKRDGVSDYVQRCLSGLYNSAQNDNTIQIDNRVHCAIAQIIGKLLATKECTNKLRNKLIQILQPNRGIDFQQQLMDANQKDSEAIKELTPEEGTLIKWLELIAPAFLIKADKNNNNQETTIINLIDQICLPYYTYKPDTSLMWFINNANQKYEPDELKGKNLPPEDNLKETLQLYRPDLLLVLQLLNKHGVGVLPGRFTENQKHYIIQYPSLKHDYVRTIIKGGGQLNETQDKQTSELQFKKDKRTKQHSVIQQIREEIEKAPHNHNKTQTKEQYLMEEFLKFIIGWCHKESFDKYNSSTIFQDAAERFRTVNETSVQLTPQQKNLLHQLEKAYEAARYTLFNNYKWGGYANACLAIYAEILLTVLKKGKIEASQISQELEIRLTELQQEEYERQKEERKSYAQAFRTIAYSLIALAGDDTELSPRQVLLNLAQHIQNLSEAICNPLINNGAKTIANHLEDLFEAVYKGIDVNDGAKQFIKEAILPHQQQQCYNHQSKSNKEQTAFNVKRLLIFIRLIVQTETTGQFYACQYKKVSSAKEGPTQLQSTSNNLQEREQDDSLLTEYHITHRTKNAGEQKEQQIKFENIFSIGRSLLLHLLSKTLCNLRNLIGSDEQLRPDFQEIDDGNASDKIIQILNAEKLNKGTKIKTDDQNTNNKTEAQIIIEQTEQISTKLQEYINVLPKGTDDDWANTIQRYNTQLKWILQRITKEDLSHLDEIDLFFITKYIKECINSLQEKINKQRREQEEREKREKEKKERRQKEEADDIAINQIEQLIEEWKQQKEEINNDKEAKLTKLAHDIDSLENKYKEIVNRNS